MNDEEFKVWAYNWQSNIERQLRASVVAEINNVGLDFLALQQNLFSYNQHGSNT